MTTTPPADEPRIVAVSEPLDVTTWIVAPGEPCEFDATLVMMLQHMTSTRRTLATMREEMPRLDTLTTIDVLYDIVMAIRTPVPE